MHHNIVIDTIDDFKARYDRSAFEHIIVVHLSLSLDHPFYCSVFQVKFLEESMLQVITVTQNFLCKHWESAAHVILFLIFFVRLKDLGLSSTGR